VRFFQPDDQTLQVKLEAERIGEGRIATSIAAPFIHRLNEIIQALGGYAQSKALGKRGPLPGVTGAAGISLSGLTPGSAVLHFSIGEGEEQLVLTPSGEVASAMEQAVQYLFDLIAAAGTDETDQHLLENLREFDPRIGSELSHLLDVLVTHNVTTTWSRPDAADVHIPVPRAAVARLALDRETDLHTEDVVRVGYLYEADAKAHTFRFEQPASAGTLRGTYDEAYTDTVRGSWGKLVRVRLQLTRRRLERKRQAEPDTVHLIEVIEILDDLEGLDEL
jgi:hypothetical protein